MYTSVRRYTTNPIDAAAIIDIVRRSNVAELIRGIPGCVAYYVVDGGEGTVATISIFEDQAGAEQSNAVAADWVKENVLPTFSMNPPEITAGEVVISA